MLDDFDPEWEYVNSLCKELGITEFVERLPNGLKTNIGENGQLLSGGQRQRIAIARALYRDPEVLILDEATSSLDSESELTIKKLLQKLRKQGKTIILIAHRLGTIMSADQIIVLKNGKLVEQGTHHELIKTKGQYSKFWQVQTETLMT